jgi:N6-adenosine-specific RNA methylase IME4
VSAWEGLTPPYSTIVADPPWPFKWSGGPGGRRRSATPLRYSLMSLADIAALPVEDVAAAEAHLYLWVTREMFREGHGVAVARSWGFDPVAEFIWRKPNFGTGSFPRAGHEPVLVCRRGGLPFAGPRNVHSVQEWKQDYSQNSGKSHTTKPTGLMDLVEKASPGPYVELFARAPRLGWDSWGKGYEIGDVA